VIGLSLSVVCETTDFEGEPIGALEAGAFILSIGDGCDRHTLYTKGSKVSEKYNMKRISFERKGSCLNAGGSHAQFFTTTPS
jgi:hypothetical protein